jgi:hypothetical protein
MHSRTLRRSGIRSCQSNLDARLIEVHAIARRHLTHLLLMEATWFLDRFSVTLGCMISLLFPVSFSRARVRCRLDRLGLTGQRSA